METGAQSPGQRDGAGHNTVRLAVRAELVEAHSPFDRLRANELKRTVLGLDIQVHHFPPDTRKWNKIEHRLFSFITMNWRGRPLISHAVIVNPLG